ncbi:ABC transporter substrate-binding protein [Arthrobacter ginkgonis]|uniref:ABC transporter substrate-binding protein n=1 Tax=Arthrobacter ginkgonis TaxID=1630594 RepID=A0ABP7DJH0_9MICC
MKSTRSVLRLAAAVVAAGALALSASACGSSSGAAEAGTYKVGVLVGLTGAYAALGEPEKKAIELYFDKVNADGGIDGKKVELVVLDSATDEATSVNQLRKLATQEQVVAVLGPSSTGESVAIRSFANSLKVPVIALASGDNIIQPADEAKYMFKQYTGTTLSLEGQFAYAKEQGWSKIALLATNDGYGQAATSIAPEVAKKFGIELVASEVFNATATDVTAQLSKIKPANADSLLVWASNPANAIVAKSAAAMNFAPTLFNSPGAGSPVYVESGGAATNETLLQGSKVLAADTLDATDPQYEVTKNLVDQYQEAYSEMPGQYAANGWDGAILLENALETAAPDPSNVQAAREGIRDALEGSTDKIVGVNAIYSFSPEVHGPSDLVGLTVLRVKEGEFHVEKSY